MKQGRGRSDKCKYRGRGLQFSLILAVMCLQNLEFPDLLSPEIMVMGLFKNSRVRSLDADYAC